MTNNPPRRFVDLPDSDRALVVDHAAAARRGALDPLLLVLKRLRVDPVDVNAILDGVKWVSASEQKRTGRRESFLAREENFFCAECLKNGRYISATVVDHVVPHRGDSNLFWSESNWSAKCARCHNTKTAKQDGGFGRKVVSA